MKIYLNGIPNQFWRDFSSIEFNSYHCRLLQYCLIVLTLDIWIFRFQFMRVISNSAHSIKTSLLFIQIRFQFVLFRREFILF